MIGDEVRLDEVLAERIGRPRAARARAARARRRRGPAATARCREPRARRHAGEAPAARRLPADRAPAPRDRSHAPRLRRAVPRPHAPRGHRAHGERKLDLHRRLAVALEATDADTQPMLVGVHWEQAGGADPAPRRCTRAGDRATEALAFERGAAVRALHLARPRHVAGAAREARRRVCERGARPRGRRGVPRTRACPKVTSVTRTRSSSSRRRRCSSSARGTSTRAWSTSERLLESADIALPKTPRRALASLLWRRARVKVRGTKFKPRDETPAVARGARADRHRVVGGVRAVDERLDPRRVVSGAESVAVAERRRVRPHAASAAARGVSRRCEWCAERARRATRRRRNRRRGARRSVLARLGPACARVHRRLQGQLAPGLRARREVRRDVLHQLRERRGSATRCRALSHWARSSSAR